VRERLLSEWFVVVVVDDVDDDDGMGWQVRRIHST